MSHEPFKIYRADVSYFSGKMESYLRYKEIPFELIEMNASNGVTDIYANTGVRKVPAIASADGLWFRESTNMIDWFEEHYNNQPIHPSDPALAFLSKLVEDYADEWCWRSAMYWRWHDKDNAQYQGSRIGQDVFADWPIPTSWSGFIFRKRQQLVFMKGDGVTTQTEAVVRQQYFQLADAFTELLADQPFLLGNKPTLVDIGFMGPFFRHYFSDPFPASVMRSQYPAVLEWVARVWNAQASGMPLETQLSDFSHKGWEFILQELVQDYLPYLQQNKIAWQAGKKKFDNSTTKATFKNIPFVHHRVYCLEQLEQQYQALDQTTLAQVNAVLEPYGAVPLDGNTDSGISHTYKLPLEPRPPLGKLEYLEVYLLGSAWDMNRPPKG